MLLTLPLLPQLFADSVTDSCSSLFHYPCPPPHSSPQYLMAESEVTDQSLHPLGCIWLHGILLCGLPRYFTSFELTLGTFKCLSGICFGRGSVIKICSQRAAPWDKYGDECAQLQIFLWSLKKDWDWYRYWYSLGTVNTERMMYALYSVRIMARLITTCCYYFMFCETSLKMWSYAISFNLSRWPATICL